MATVSFAQGKPAACRVGHRTGGLPRAKVVPGLGLRQAPRGEPLGRKFRGGLGPRE